MLVQWLFGSFLAVFSEQQFVLSLLNIPSCCLEWLRRKNDNCNFISNKEIEPGYSIIERNSFSAKAKSFLKCSDFLICLLINVIPVPEVEAPGNDSGFVFRPTE